MKYLRSIDISMIFSIFSKKKHVDGPPHTLY